MWANFKTNCFRTRFTLIWNKISYIIWNKIVLFYIKQYLSNFLAPTLRASVTSSPNEIRMHYYKLPFVGPFSTYAQHRIKRLTQRYCKNLVIKLVFAPYKIKNLFSAKDAISNLSPSRVVYKFSCTGCSACYVGETNRHLATRVREHLTSDKNSHIFQSPHVRESRTVLDSGFHAVDSGFRVLDSGFQHSGFRIPKRAGFHFFYRF